MRSVAALLKISEVAVERVDAPRRFPRPSPRPRAAPAASTLSAVRSRRVRARRFAPDCSIRFRSTPWCAGTFACDVAVAQAEHELDVVAQPVGARPIGLVDDEDVGDLHHARLQRLDRIARLRDEHDQRRVGGARDVELALPDADGLDEDAVEAERVEHVAHLARRRGEPAERAARRHRADEHARIERDALHADAVAEQRAAGERRRRIDRDDADRQALRAILASDQRGDRALARARRTGDADAARAAELRVQRSEQLIEAGAMVLDDADRAGEGEPFPALKSFIRFSVVVGKYALLPLPHLRAQSCLVVGVIVTRDVECAVDDQSHQLLSGGMPRFRAFLAATSGHM